MAKSIRGRGLIPQIDVQFLRFSNFSYLLSAVEREQAIQHRGARWRRHCVHGHAVSRRRHSFPDLSQCLFVGRFIAGQLISRRTVVKKGGENKRAVTPDTFLLSSPTFDRSIVYLLLSACT